MNCSECFFFIPYLAQFENIGNDRKSHINNLYLIIYTSSMFIHRVDGIQRRRQQQQIELVVHIIYPIITQPAVRMNENGKNIK